MWPRRSRSGQVEALELFLEHEAPRNLLMPAIGKIPARRHKGGAWSWTKWRQHRRLLSRQSHPDVCVLVHDLCIVDVDDPALATDIERRFGHLLQNAPAERTARGRHYWFRRSRLCDEGEHYDARSPLIRGVDLKTRHANGTSSVLLVAPSTDKTWIRAPWDKGVRLSPIPDELLMAVSQPKRRTALLSLKFPEAARPRSVRVRLKTLEAMHYFDPFFDDMKHSEHICVPCTLDDFVAVNHLLGDNVDKESWFPTVKSLRRAVRTADMLGVSRDRLLDGALVGKLMAYVHMECLPWAQDCVSMEVIDVTSIGEVAYCPLDAADPDHIPVYQLWADTYPGPCVEPGAVVLHGRSVRQRCARNIPPIVLGLMQKFPLALAGGGALYAATHAVSDSSDWDLYMYGVDDEARANAILSQVHAALDSSERRVVSAVMPPRISRNAATFVVAGLVIQIVAQLHDRPQDVIRKFDLAPCQIAAWIENDRPVSEMEVCATFGCVESLRRMAVIMYRPCAWTAMVGYRVIKYAAKGFAIFVPGIVADAISDPDPSDASLPIPESIIDPSAGLLLQLEHVMQYLDPSHDSARSRGYAYLKCLHACKYAYDSQLKEDARAPSVLRYMHALWTIYARARRRPREPSSGTGISMAWKAQDDLLGMRVDPQIAKAHGDPVGYRAAAAKVLGIRDYLTQAQDADDSCFFSDSDDERSI